MKKLILIITILLASCAPEKPRTLLQTVALPRLTITQNGRVLTGKDCNNVYSQVIVRADNVTISGCSFINSNEFVGVVIFEGNNGQVLDSFFSGYCRAAVVLHGQFNLVQGNEIEKGKDCINGTSHSDADGIRVLNSNNTVRGNYIHDLNPERASFPHVDGIQGDFPNYQFKNIVIENNIIDSLQAGIQSDGLACDNVTINNNIIRGDRPLNMSCDNLKVTNNIFYGIGTVSFIGIRDGSSNVTFQNNIVCGTTDGIISKSVTLGGGNTFYTEGKAPRRDSGYSGNGTRWPSDKWQIFTDVCTKFGTGVSTPQSPTATQTQITPTLTPSVTPSASVSQTASVVPSVTPTITLLPTFTATPSRTPSRTPTRTASPTATKTPFQLLVNGTPVFCVKPCQIVIP